MNAAVARSIFRIQNCKIAPRSTAYFWTFDRPFAWQAQWILHFSWSAQNVKFLLQFQKRSRRGTFEQELQRCTSRNRRSAGHILINMLGRQGADFVIGVAFLFFLTACHLIWLSLTQFFPHAICFLSRLLCLFFRAAQTSLTCRAPYLSFSDDADKTSLPQCKSCDGVSWRGMFKVEPVEVTMPPKLSWFSSGLSFHLSTRRSRMSTAVYILVERGEIDSYKYSDRWKRRIDKHAIG